MSSCHPSLKIKRQLIYMIVHHLRPLISHKVITLFDQLLRAFMSVFGQSAAVLLYLVLCCALVGVLSARAEVYVIWLCNAPLTISPLPLGTF